MKTVIYDFNGTILDDVDTGVIAINALIDKYLDRGPLSKEEYKHIFRFPVMEYYKDVGFDFDKLDFRIIGQEWMDIYEANKDIYHLYPGIRDQLINNRRIGMRNILLSASRQDKLLRQCQELGIDDLFEEILGIDDIYASSKVYIASDWMSKQKDGEYIFIGDTLHDLEVADELNIDCILVANGHQAKEVLLEKTDRVYDDIREVVNDPYWSI